MATRRTDDTPPDLSPLADQPPSVKLMYLVLYYEGKMSQSTLADRLDISQRTVRYAASRLLDETDTINQRDNYRDSRETIYVLKDDAGQS